MTAAKNHSALKFILATGLLVGSLDILTAFVDFYIARRDNPLIVLQYIASGVFRKTAFTDGAIMYFWGLLFHFIIAYSFTLLFYLLYPKMKLYKYNPIPVAIVYGLFIYAVMNFVVQPLVFGEPWHFNGFKSIKAALILIVMIGLPLAFLCKKHFSTKKPAVNNLAVKYEK
jgi:hypothetical protein